MARERKTLTTADAEKYTRDLKRKAKASGVELDYWILGMGKPNDVPQGTGARHAIVARAQEWAEKGARYGLVLESLVLMGDGRKYTIKEEDLAGFVCANGYCTITPPVTQP